MAATKLAEYEVTLQTGEKRTIKGHILLEGQGGKAIVIMGKTQIAGRDRYMLFHAPSGLCVAAEDFQLAAEAKKFFNDYLYDQDFPEYDTPMCPNCDCTTEISLYGLGNTATCRTCGASAFLGYIFYQTYPQEWQNLTWKAPLPKCYTDECSACGGTGRFYQDGKPVACGYCRPRPADDLKRVGNLSEVNGTDGRAIFGPEYARHDGGVPVFTSLRADEIFATRYVNAARQVLIRVKDGYQWVHVHELQPAPEAPSADPATGPDGQPLSCSRCLTPILKGQDYRINGSGTDFEAGVHHNPDCSHPHILFNLPKSAEPEYCACDMPAIIEARPDQCAYCLKALKPGTFAPEYGPGSNGQPNYIHNPLKWYGYLARVEGFKDELGTPCYTYGGYAVEPTQGGYIIKDKWGDNPTTYNFRVTLAEAMAVAEHYAENGIAEWYAGKGPALRQPPGMHIGPPADAPAPVATPESNTAVLAKELHKINTSLYRLQDQFDAFASLLALISVKLGIGFDNLAPVPSLDFAPKMCAICGTTPARQGGTWCQACLEAKYADFDANLTEINKGLENQDRAVTDQLGGYTEDDVISPDDPAPVAPEICGFCNGTGIMVSCNDTGPCPNPNCTAKAPEPPVEVTDDDQAATDAPAEYPGLNFSRLTCPKCGSSLQDGTYCTPCQITYITGLDDLNDLLVAGGKLEADDLRAILDFSPDWVEWAAMKMAARQNAGELASGYTDNENSIGYNKPDAAWGSQMYKALMQYGSLTPNQIKATRKVLQKYIKSQLLGIANHVPSRPQPAPFKKGDLVLHGDFTELWRVDRVNMWAGVAECINDRHAVAQFHPQDLKLAPEGYEAEPVEDGLEEMDL